MNRYNEIYSYLTLNPNFNSEFFLLQAKINRRKIQRRTSAKIRCLIDDRSLHSFGRDFCLFRDYSGRRFAFFYPGNQGRLSSEHDDLPLCVFHFARFLSIFILIWVVAELLRSLLLLNVISATLAMPTLGLEIHTAAMVAFGHSCFPDITRLRPTPATTRRNG